MNANPVLAMCRQAVPDMLSLTERLVNMDSGSDDLPGLERKVTLLERLFAERGAETRLAESLPPGSGRRNLIAAFHGRGKARILLLTHYDTVFPPGEAARRPFSCDGEKAYGPGVADMQASIAMLLTGIPLFHAEEGHPYHTLTVFCNAEEETGSWGSRDLIRDLAAQHDITLNMELSGAEGNLITVSGRGMANGTLTVRGKAAHSAAEPPAGVNAGLELAHQMLRLRELSRPEIRTSVNITMGHFGTKANVIPDHAEALINIRVARVEEFDRVEADIRRSIQDKLLPDAEVGFSMQSVFAPYGNTSDILELADKVRALAREELGLELGYRHAIGGNDTSFSAECCPSLDGFGPGCVAMHSVDEYLPVHTLAPRLYILLRTLREICLGRFVPLNRHGQKEKRA